MPAPKRSSSSSKKSSTAAKPAAKRSGAAAAKSGAKATATSARKAAAGTAAQAKAGAAKTASTAKTGAKQTRTSAKSAATKTRRASASSTSASVPEQLATGDIKPRDVVMLTRERIQDILDDAAARGRVTRKDANELVGELVRRGRQQGDDVRGEIDQLLERGRGQLGSATKKALKREPVDRIVREADRARRKVGVGPSFPILGYDELNVPQVKTRLGDLSKPQLRKVLTYERAHANRKSVTAALEKAIG
ncbi:MAG TPA: hypothetical protein VN880_01940 [Solirubrobacteraceae bacterium]|nr:hypothetical protein [Solirubrobacteraceae bacterium]